MITRLGSMISGTLIIVSCLHISGCGQKGPLYLPDDNRTAADRAASEPAPRQTNADSGMPETGISTSEVPSRISREIPEEQLDEEGVTAE